MPGDSSGANSMDTAYPTWTQRVVAHLVSDPGAPALFSITSDRVDSWTRAEFASMTSGANDLLDTHGVAEGEVVPALLSPAS